MSKATLEKLPQSEGADYFIVLDPKEGIVHHAYTADLGRSFGHDHIKDAQLDGVTSAARWVVRPLFATNPAAAAPVVVPEPAAAVTEVMGLVQDYFVTGTDEARDAIETKLRALLTAVSTPAAHADALGTFPTMTDELASILGLMCFQCISFAQALRAGGYSIKKRAEDEQAAVLHWMLGHYFHSGADGWRAAARADMERMCKASTKEGGAA